MVTINVSNAAQLQAALVPSSKGATIKVAAGTYAVGTPLVVPEKARLEGAGGMTIDAMGLPTGVPKGAGSRLVAASALQGDILTLKNGAEVAGLVVEDVAGRNGNLIAVTSMNSKEDISATIEDCELVNPNPSAATLAGPMGRGLLVVTRNPPDRSPEPGHDRIRLAVEMRRSLIRSPANGSGIFAVNFAAVAEIELRLAGNVIGGGLDTAGGVSRGRPTYHSRTAIISHRNVYRSDGKAAAGIGLFLHGGTTPPAPVASLAAAFTTDNSLSLKSKRDRIEGFATAVYAAAAWRPFSSSGPVSRSHVDLDFEDLLLTSGAADLHLVGAESGVGVSATGASPEFTPGDDNRLSVTMKNVTGSGPRSNFYANAVLFSGGAIPAALAGTGNRLEILNDIRTFAASNKLQPAPPVTFFV